MRKPFKPGEPIVLTKNGKRFYSGVHPMQYDVNKVYVFKEYFFEAHLLSNENTCFYKYMVRRARWYELPGTRSVLFGAHCFFLHPFFVAAAWWRLYGFPFDPRLWFAFFLHDIGYIGKPNMDGAEGEQHPVAGAKIMGALFGQRWHDFTMYHSRFLAKKNGKQYSKLCVADKLATCITPDWLYMPMVRLTGEIKEYMQEAGRNSGGTVKVQENQHKWRKEVKEYLLKWVEEHKDLKQDNWTSANRQAEESGVYK